MPDCRPILAAVSLLLGLVHGQSPARAGDQAELEIHGFTANGSRFAFEQYGIQDGSGFPYSELFVIDVDSDSWVSPSPIKSREENIPEPVDFEALLNDTRHTTLQAAAESGVLAGIAVRGQTVGHNPVTELSADPFQLVVNPRLVVPPVDDPLEVTLAEHPLPDPTCASYGANTRGFLLTIAYQGTVRELHFDKTLPKSRGCPIGYRIDRVVTYYPDGNAPALAILIHMATHGFEGPDGRFLAITTRM